MRRSTRAELRGYGWACEVRRILDAGKTLKTSAGNLNDGVETERVPSGLTTSVLGAKGAQQRQA